MADIHEETKLLADAQRMADAATVLYGVPPVSVVLVDATETYADGEYDPALREVRLKRAMVTRATWHGVRAQLAHEFGHVTLQHTEDLCVEIARAEQMEMDATARGVEILVRVVGLPVHEAVDHFVQSFRRLKTRLELEPTALLEGTPHPDVALRDLLSRFGMEADSFEHSSSPDTATRTDGDE